MEDDIAYYRILEFFLALALIVPAAAECRENETLQGGRCVCIEGRTCGSTPFHNVEIYVCCGILGAFLLANLAATLYYTRSVLHELQRRVALTKREARQALSWLHKDIYSGA